MSDHPGSYLDNTDSLSSALSSLRLSAEVYANGDYCGQWAVDTSGSRRMPFHLIGRGEAWLHIDDAAPRRLSAGDLVVFPHDQRHIIASSAVKPAPELINAGTDTAPGHGPVTHMICGFFDIHSRTTWPLLDSLAPVIVLDVSDLSSTPTIRTLADLIISELNRQAPGFYAAINQLAYLLFIQIIRHQIAAGKIDSGPLVAMFDHRIGKALAVIHNYPNKRWTLATLAAEAIMGRSSFAKRFNELTGSPPMQYLTAWRMQQATQLIAERKLSIAEIAERCGYESEAAFRKGFKKVTGKTPGSVRKG